MYAADYMGDISGEYHIESGLIAQDLLNIPDLSYCVHIPDDPETEIYAVSYNDIFVWNIAATKELDAKNTALEARVSDLQAENATLKQQMADVLARVSALEN